MKHPVKRYLTVVKERLKTRLGRHRIKRRYIDPELGIENFFRILKREEIEYCVLRWFEMLPDLEPGEDIDILVADRDVHRIEKFLTGSKTDGIPCDLYSAGGLPGTSYRGISYFPEHIAEDILKNHVWQNDNIRVPSPEHHFLSMAYHAVYHKGYASDLPSVYENSEEPSQAEHDYPSILKVYSERVQMEPVTWSLEGVDVLLNEKGWAPSRDALEKLSSRNQWIHDNYFKNLAEPEEHWKGFSVFIVREKGLEYLDYIRSLLIRAGFDVLFEEAISDEKREESRKKLRGGNWNRGPWPASGGIPAYLFAVYDHFPLRPEADILKKHPGLSNQRLLTTKIQVRDGVNGKRSKKEYCNVLHSSDNPHQALEYLRTSASSKETEENLETRLRELNMYHNDLQPGFQTFGGHQRRAKVELIHQGNTVAVRKSYRPGREVFLEREILARVLGSRLPEMSPIIESGHGYIVMPYYDDILDRNAPLPVSLLVRTRSIILYFREKGYELIDFKPKNIILDREQGMKIIDFEFMQKSMTPDNKFKGNYCWYKVPHDFSGDLPVSRQKQRNNYYRYWFSTTGIPLWFAERQFSPPMLRCIQIAGRSVLFLRRISRTFRKGAATLVARARRILGIAARKLLF